MTDKAKAEVVASKGAPAGTHYEVWECRNGGWEFGECYETLAEAEKDFSGVTYPAHIVKITLPAIGEK